MSVEGFDELIKRLESMGKSGGNIENKALKVGAAIIVEEQRKNAPKDTSNGAKELQVGSIKTAKSKNKYVQVGITPGVNWDKAKGIYFQHHGYRNHRTNKYHAATLWMDKSFLKAKEKAMGEMLSILQRELNL